MRRKTQKYSASMDTSTLWYTINQLIRKQQVAAQLLEASKMTLILTPIQATYDE